MLKQIDQSWWYKLNGAGRLFLASGAAKWGWFPLLNEYPKCGGSWMAQMLADALEIRFPRNRLPHATSCLLHGHYQEKSIGTDVVIVNRDGRDVMVSLYYHRIVGNQFTASKMQEELVTKLGIDDPADVEKYLPRFIEAVGKRQVYPYYSWSDFCDQWHQNPKVCSAVKYEEMKADAAAALTRVVKDLGRDISDAKAHSIAGQYSFATQSQRKPGEENTKSYLRKGIVGDWQEKFNAESRQVFDHHMGEALIALGYETNSSWVRNS